MAIISGLFRPYLHKTYTNASDRYNKKAMTTHAFL
jgi:hypothetical protein